MRFIKDTTVILLLFYMTFSCKNDPAQPQLTNPDIPDDFPVFYESFHSDSSFQMEHILFPLDGRPAADTAKIFLDDFQWQKESWKIHNFDHFDPALFEVSRKVTDSTLITEIIRDRTSGFGIKRRFAKFGEKWYLIYYDAMNPTP